ncbi:Hint domain-containing protein [Defluviimonas sp. SAOS-178_SWC]|uniref:Hint domain-containing protein n=1 Tax=Defluviimonas sp. SAOS-178_SWC TaxID=3121287 RepID=UPI003221C0A2
MATTFNWIYLGTSSTMLDPTEGNTTAENINAFVGSTFGSSGNPLYTHITSATMVNVGGSATALDGNNNLANDRFTTDIGSGTQTFTFDISVQYNATVTYADGTTGTVTAVVLQSTTGQLFLAPETAAGSDTNVYEAKPIQSITFNSAASYSGNLGTDRYVTGFDDGFVEGTAGNDLINASYVEPVANGTDRIDNGDGISSAGTAWQDDRVRAGAGNDTVLAGLGNDYVDGGTGADSIDGGSGNDSLYGGDGVFNDTILGGDGNDTIDGGDGNDSLLGGAGADSIAGGAGDDYVDGGDGSDIIDGGPGNDTLIFGAGDDTVHGGDGNDFIDDAIGAQLVGANLLDGGAGNDTIYGGGGDDTLIGGADDDRLFGEDGADSLDGGTGNDALDGGTGNDTLIGGAGDDTMTGGTGSDYFAGLTAGDVVDGSEDAGGGDNDVLDLFGSGWTKATTNIVFSTPDHENGTVELLDGSGNVVGTMTFSNIETIVPCFTPGTRIETRQGPVAVERLKAGDRVLTKDHGYQTLRWIGRRDLTPADLAAHPTLRPILIRAGAFGPAMPARDMRLSPQHRVLLSGARAELFAGEAEVFAPAVHFVGLSGVVRDAASGGTSYIHLLFDRHEIVRSDGIWSESFQPAAAMLSGLERDQRDEVLALFPELIGDLSPANNGNYPAARSTVKRHEARLILAS